MQAFMNHASKLDGKLPVMDLENLLKDLCNLDSKDAKKVITEATSLKGLMESIAYLQQQRSCIDTTKDSFTKQVALLAANELGVEDVWKRILIVSEALQSCALDKNVGYKHNPYQCLLAAQLCAKTKPWKMLLLAPGQGKTFVMMLVARYLFSKTSTTNFMFITPNTVMQRQFNLHLTNHPLPGSYMEAIQVKSFKETKQQYPNACFLIDEGDLFIYNNLIDFSCDTEFQGLVSWRFDHLYLFSATLPEYWKKILKVGLQMADDQFVEAVPQLKLTEGADDTVNISGNTYPDLSSVLEGYKSLCEELITSRPLVVFVTDEKEMIK